MATLHNIINNHCQNTLLFDNLVIRNYQRVVAGLASNLPVNFGTQSLWTWGLYKSSLTHSTSLSLYTYNTLLWQAAILWTWGFSCLFYYLYFTVSNIYLSLSKWKTQFWIDNAPAWCAHVLLLMLAHSTHLKLSMYRYIFSSLNYTVDFYYTTGTCNIVWVFNLIQY